MTLLFQVHLYSDGITWYSFFKIFWQHKRAQREAFSFRVQCVRFMKWHGASLSSVISTYVHFEELCSLKSNTQLWCLNLTKQQSESEHRRRNYKCLKLNVMITSNFLQTSLLMSIFLFIYWWVNTPDSCQRTTYLPLRDTKGSWKNLTVWPPEPSTCYCLPPLLLLNPQCPFLFILLTTIFLLEVF